MYKLAIFNIISHPVGQKINKQYVKMSENINSINPFYFLAALIFFREAFKIN